MRTELAPNRLCRTLQFERLEDRRVLATFTVTNLNDAPVSLPGAAPGTLRQAVYDANHSPGADTIQFALDLQGAVNLSIADDNVAGLSALVISSPITIQGNTNGVTIARNGAAAEMRLFHVTSTGDLTLNSVSITGGIVRGANGAASGDPGGEARGGAIYNQGTLRVVASTLYGNQAIGGNGGSAATGGSGRGGAIYSDSGSLIITNATISGSSAQSGTGSLILSSFGGAIYIKNGSLAVYNSTITNSTASTGRGIYILSQGGSATADIWSSIIGQNDAPIQARDFLTAIDEDSQLTVTGGNNLIRTQGDYEFITVSTDDPLLAPLGDNGGPTMTHELLAGSPALDLGSNPQSLAVDQRGASYARVVGGAADIGAVEMQSITGPSQSGDYNGNHVVDAADYVLWRKTLGNSVAPHSNADGDGDGTVDAADYGVWRSTFGLTNASGSALTSSVKVVATLQSSLPRLQSEAVALSVPHNRLQMAGTVPGDSDRARDLAILGLVASSPTRSAQWDISTTVTDAGESSQAPRSGEFNEAVWQTWSSTAEVCTTEFTD